MKSFLSPVLAIAGLVAVALGTAGCAQRYLITTTNGSKIVTASKPKLVQSKYVYKDANGHLVEISTLRVRVIEPYSEESAKRTRKLPELQ